MQYESHLSRKITASTVVRGVSSPTRTAPRIQLSPRSGEWGSIPSLEYLGYGGMPASRVESKTSLSPSVRCSPRVPSYVPWHASKSTPRSSHPRRSSPFQSPCGPSQMIVRQNYRVITTCPLFVHLVNAPSGPAQLLSLHYLQVLFFLFFCVFGRFISSLVPLLRSFFCLPLGVSDLLLSARPLFLHHGRLGSEACFRQRVAALGSREGHF